MLVVNGYIKIKTVTGGGLDPNGYPVPPTETWGNAIECQFIANSHNSQGYSNAGQFTTHDYTVLLEMQSFPYSTIRLYNDENTLIGEFEVKHVERLLKVDKVRLKI